MAIQTTQESKGFYKLSWLQRIGFGSGDMAQNLIYQTISIWLLFFYTNVYGLNPGTAAFMFLIVRLIDVLWDPIVGTFVDKGNPKGGKYRSWLILGGIPLVGLSILCFWNGFSGSVVYAYITYVGMSMCYTLVNVPYGALNSSLTRDTDEITILTSTRMFMANLGALIVKSLPLVIAVFAPIAVDGKAITNTPEAAPAWFITMTIFALAGLALLIFCFSQCKERVVMDQKEAANVKVSDLYTEFLRNRPLRILAFFFITAFAMMSVGNAADAYFMTYNVNATPVMTTAFMWLGTIPAFIFMPLVPAIKKMIGKKGMFYLFLGVAILGMVMMYMFVQIPSLKTFPMLCIAQFVKSTGIIVATGYMWALVPEVVSYGEYTTGRRIAGIVNALTGIFFKAGMALGGVVPGLVLAIVGFYTPQTKSYSEMVAENSKAVEEIVQSCESSENLKKTAADFSIAYNQLSKCANSNDSIQSFEDYSSTLLAQSDKLNTLFKSLSDEAKGNGVLSENVLGDLEDNLSEMNEKAKELVSYSKNLKEGGIDKYTAKDANELMKHPVQTSRAEQGILWLVCVIPAILLLLAMWIISKYELEDDVIDKINKEIEARNNNEK